MLRFFMTAGYVIAAFLLLLACPVSADIYKYTDENGVVCYTDAPFGKKTERVIKEKKVPAAETKVPVSPVRTSYSHYVNKAASKYEIEPELINAVIKTESNGNHRAVSRKGAMGLMQLMPSTASDMNVGNPFSPEENIEGGTRYLRYLLEKFNGDTTLALAAYNAGPKTVEKYNSVPPISETRAYVRKVLSLFSGRQNYTVLPQEQKPEVQAPTPVYKVTLEDGTILFTNSSIAKAGRVRF